MNTRSELRSTCRSRPACTVAYVGGPCLAVAPVMRAKTAPAGRSTRDSAHDWKLPPFPALTTISLSRSGFAQAGRRPAFSSAGKTHNSFVMVGYLVICERPFYLLWMSSHFTTCIYIVAVVWEFSCGKGVFNIDETTWEDRLVRIEMAPIKVLLALQGPRPFIIYSYFTQNFQDHVHVPTTTMPLVSMSNGARVIYIPPVKYVSVGFLTLLAVDHVACPAFMSQWPRRGSSYE